MQETFLRNTTKSARKTLFVSQNPQPPHSKEELNRLFHLSKSIQGEVISGCWFSSNSKDYQIASKSYGSIKANLISWTSHSKVSKLYFIFRILLTSFKKIRTKQFENVEVYGPFILAFFLLLFRCFYNFNLIVFVPGHPVNGRMVHPSKRDFIYKIRLKISSFVAKFVCKKANKVLTLYPNQLECFNLPLNKSIVTRSFVPVSYLEDLLFKEKLPNQSNQEYLVFLGHPFFLKGVDILIEAFCIIQPDFPNLELKIYGHHDKSDLEYFKSYIKGSASISINKGVPFKEGINLIKNAKALVLPSRTEAMGRVIIESMALKTPVIASDVDGIPHYIENLETGILFKNGNAEDLALKLKILLSNKTLSLKLSDNAYKKVMVDFKEDLYVEDWISAIS